MVHMNDTLQQRLDKLFEVHHARSKQTDRCFWIKFVIK